MESTYQQRKADKIDRLQARAAKTESLAESTHEQAQHMASIIPLGQPILLEAQS
jgi:hypothetical protein